MARLNNNARNLAPFCSRQWTWKYATFRLASDWLVGWLRAVCVFFHVYAVLDPEVFYPDVLMDHWPRVVSLFFLRRISTFLPYSLLKFHISSEFFSFHFGLIPRGLCVCIRSGYVSQVSFNWLFSCRVFRAGQRTWVLFFGFVFGRLADILQSVNKRIFQQSICVVWHCVYVVNLLADNSQELKKLKPRFASSKYSKTYLNRGTFKRRGYYFVEKL